jgi:hypothetical protein
MACMFSSRVRYDVGHVLTKLTITQDLGLSREKTFLSCISMVVVLLLQPFFAPFPLFQPSVPLSPENSLSVLS